jgi:hypothetical protein
MENRWDKRAADGPDWDKEEKSAVASAACEAERQIKSLGNGMCVGWALE